MSRARRSIPKLPSLDSKLLHSLDYVDNRLHPDPGLITCQPLSRAGKGGLKQTSGADRRSARRPQLPRQIGQRHNKTETRDKKRQLGRENDAVQFGLLVTIPCYIAT